MITAPKCTLSLKVTQWLPFPPKLQEQTTSSSLRPALAGQIPPLPEPEKSRDEEWVQTWHLPLGLSRRQKLDVRRALLGQSPAVLCGKRLRCCCRDRTAGYAALTNLRNLADSSLQLPQGCSGLLSRLHRFVHNQEPFQKRSFHTPEPPASRDSPLTKLSSAPPSPSTGAYSFSSSALPSADAQAPVWEPTDKGRKRRASGRDFWQMLLTSTSHRSTGIGGSTPRWQSKSHAQ